MSAILFLKTTLSFSMLEVRKLRPRQITRFAREQQLSELEPDHRSTDPSRAFTSDHVTSWRLLQTAVQGSAIHIVDVTDLFINEVLSWQMAVRVLL